MAKLKPNDYDVYMDDSDNPYKDPSLDQLITIRKLAERGRLTPLLGGEAFIFWGWFLAAMLGFLSFFGLGEAAAHKKFLLGVWIIFPLIAAIGTYFLFKKYADDSHAPRYQNIIISRIWAMITAGLLLFSALEIISGFTRPEIILIFSSLFFAVGLGATSVLVKSRVVLIAAIGWLLIIIPLYFIVDISKSLLLVALASILFLVFPGVAMRKERNQAIT